MIPVKTPINLTNKVSDVFLIDGSISFLEPRRKQQDL